MLYAFPAILLIAFAASWFATGKTLGKLVKHAIMDIPNDRSMHKIPIPRGGGVAVTGVIVLGLLIYFGFHRQQYAEAALYMGVMLILIICFEDDRRKGIAPLTRLVFQFLAAIIGHNSFGHAELFQGLLPYWLDYAVTVTGWVWFMNLYNFMDGIDGITGMETISLAAAIAILFTLLHMNNLFTLTLTALLIGASAGFLMLNWYPAKIFLGDVGSVPLGFLTGYLLLRLGIQGQLAAAVILPLYYLADSGITILKRLLRGEKIWQAHRQHFYQRAAQGVGRHDKIVIHILTGNLALFAAAILSLSYPWPALGLAIAAVAFLLGKLHKDAASQPAQP